MKTLFYSIELLVSLSLCSTFTQATSPPNPTRGEASQDFKWAVTSFNKIPPIRERIDHYINRIKGHSSSLHEYFHTLHPDVYWDKADELTTSIEKAHQEGFLNDEEFQIYRNNIWAKLQGHFIIKNGHAVRIDDTIHHPLDMHKDLVAADYRNGKTAKMLLTPVSGVNDKTHGIPINAMTLLDAPPKHLQYHSNSAFSTDVYLSSRPLEETRAGPSSHQKRRGKAPVGQEMMTDSTQKAHSWLVTSKLPTVNDHGHTHMTESIENYRQRSMKKESILHAQGINHGIHSYVYTPHPILHDPINQENFRPSLLQKLKEQGYSNERLKLVDENMNQLTRSWKFIKDGGAVYFPDSVHHPKEMKPFDALRLHLDPKFKGAKVDHLTVTRNTGDSQFTTGAGHRFQFTPAPPADVVAAYYHH